MSNDEFTKLFKYLEEFRKDVDKRFEEASRDRAEIKASVVELGDSTERLSPRAIDACSQSRQDGKVDSPNSRQNRC